MSHFLAVFEGDCPELSKPVSSVSSKCLERGLLFFHSSFLCIEQD